MNRDCDVLVVGAGVSGVPAAVAAARAGASVIVVEKRGAPGGAGVAALHQSICGLYTSGNKAPTAPLNGGIPAEICERLSALSPDGAPVRIGRAYVLPYVNEHLEAVYADMIAGEKNLEVRYGALAVAAEQENGTIRAVTLRQGPDDDTVEPGVVIDCSGTGVMAEIAGVPFDVAAPEERQLAGFTVRLSGVKGVDEALSVKVAYALKAVADVDRLPGHLQFSSLRGGGAGGAILKLSLPPGQAPGRRARAVSDVGLVCAALAETLPEFADANIADAAEDVMDRDGRRLKGKYVLTEDDVLGARKFDDPAARGAWPIEFWNQRTGPSYRYVPDGDWYEIPLRCLQSSTVKNLLCAGRCISATAMALASTRVMGVCMALGAAAGKHAAHPFPRSMWPSRLR